MIKGPSSAPVEALLFQPDVTACVLGHVIPVSSSSPAQFVHDHVGQSTILMMIIKNKCCGTSSVPNDRSRDATAPMSPSARSRTGSHRWTAPRGSNPAGGKTRRTASEVVSALCGRPSTSWKRKEWQDRPRAGGGPPGVRCIL
jgi:hypothetical protein